MTAQLTSPDTTAASEVDDGTTVDERFDHQTDENRRHGRYDHDPADDPDDDHAPVGRPVPPGTVVRRVSPVAVAGAVVTLTATTIQATAIGPALPAIGEAIDTPAGLLQPTMAVSGYLLGALLGLILATGRVGRGPRRAGRPARAIGPRRAVLLIGVVLFAAGTAGAGAARTIDQLIGARTAVGLGAGLLSAGAVAALAAVGAHRSRRGRRVTGPTIAVLAVALVLGPIAGGAAVEYLGWRWIFWTAALAAVLALPLVLSRPITPDPATIDRPGRTTAHPVRTAAAALSWLMVGAAVATALTFPTIRDAASSATPLDAGLLLTPVGVGALVLILLASVVTGVAAIDGPGPALAAGAFAAGAVAGVTAFAVAVDDGIADIPQIFTYGLLGMPLLGICLFVARPVHRPVPQELPTQRDDVQRADVQRRDVQRDELTDESPLSKEVPPMTTVTVRVSADHATIETPAQDVDPTPIDGAETDDAVDTVDAAEVTDESTDEATGDTAADIATDPDWFTPADPDEAIDTGEASWTADDDSEASWGMDDTAGLSDDQHSDDEADPADDSVLEVGDEADDDAEEVDPAGVITVRGPDHEPVVDAITTVIDLVGRQVARGRSNGMGGYAVGVPEPGSYVLIVRAPGFQPYAATVELGNEPGGNRPLVVDLVGECGMVGMIRRIGGEPLEGAAVTLTNPRGDVVVAQVTGTDGMYGFGELVPGSYTMTVTAKAYRPAAVVAHVPETGMLRQDVELVGGAGLHGTVRGAASRRPLPDARVSLLDSAGRVLEVVGVGADGRYRFGDLPEGEYTVVASAQPPAASTVRIEGGDDLEHDIELTFPD